MPEVTDPEVTTPAIASAEATETAAGQAGTTDRGDADEVHAETVEQDSSWPVVLSAPETDSTRRLEWSALPGVDPLIVQSLELARSALVEIADPTSIGEPDGFARHEHGLATLWFQCTLPGYPGWRWAATLARIDADAPVTVLEVELLPGEGAVLAPDWVPWSERLAQYREAQAKQAAEEAAAAEAAAAELAEDDDDDDEDIMDNDFSDFDDEIDGIDIDDLDDDELEAAARPDVHSAHSDLNAEPEVAHRADTAHAENEGTPEQTEVAEPAREGALLRLGRALGFRRR